MSWSITKREVRRLSNEPEMANSLPGDLSIITEDTYLRYTSSEYYNEGNSLILDSGSEWLGNPNAVNTTIVANCDNTPTLTSQIIGNGVHFSLDSSEINSPFAVSIKTKLTGSQTWVDFLGVPVNYAGEVFAIIYYSNGCQTQQLHYSFDLSGTLTQIGGVTNPNPGAGGAQVYERGDIVQYMGTYFVATLRTVNAPFASEDWRPILFDNSAQGVDYQYVYDNMMGPIVALRAVRASLAKAKAPIQGGRFVSGGDSFSGGATRHDYESRLTMLDNTIAMYVSRLTRYAKENDKSDWAVYPSSSNCNVEGGRNRRRNPMQIL